MLSRRDLIVGVGALCAGSAVMRSAWAQSADRWPAEAVDLSQLRVLADIAGPEGPSLLPDGSIATVEYEKGIVIRVDASGRKQTLATLGMAPVGTAVGHDGLLYVVKLNPAGMAKAFASRGGPGGPRDTPPPADSPAGVFQINPATLACKTLYSSYEGQALVGPDDIIIDRWGDIWFTDFGVNCVYWCRTDGSAIKRVIADVPGVNGIALSPDHKTIYILGNGNLLAYTITGRGQLQQQGAQARARVVAAWPAGVEPGDGMRMEASGNVVNGCGKDGILVISPSGQILSQTKLPGLQPINMAFGGPDLKTLYIAAGGESRSKGKFVALPWPRAGMKL